LDGALRFARAAVAGVDAGRERERVLARHDGTERLRIVGFDRLNAHYPPEDLPRREVEPADRSAADAEVGLTASLFAGPDNHVAGIRGSSLEPRERLVFGRAQAPGAGLHRVTVGRKP